MVWKKLVPGLIALILSSVLQAQTDSVHLAPYKRFPVVPPFKLLQADSLSIFTKADLKKNKPVLVMLFSPECDHCLHETEEMIRHIDEFKKIQIVMTTTWPLHRMNDFISKFGLQRFGNITVGQDSGNMLPTYYNIRNLPFLAFYDKKGKLIDVFEGTLPVEKVLTKFRQKNE